MWPVRTTTSVRVTMLFLALTLLGLSVPPISAQQAPSIQQRLLVWSNLHKQASSSEATKTAHNRQIQRLLDLTSSEMRDALLETVMSASSETSHDAGLSGQQLQESVQDGVQDSVGQDGNVTSAKVCADHIAAVVTGLLSGEGWATQMLDAMGKPTPGITQGNLNWPGGYDQCLDVRANTTVTSHPYFSGQYCSLYSNTPNPFVFPAPVVITLGVCVPDTCTDQDMTAILQDVARRLNLTSTFQPVAVCAQQDKPLTDKAIVAIVICSILLCLMLMGTVLDVVCIQWPKWKLQQMEEAGLTANGERSLVTEHQPLLSDRHRKFTAPPAPRIGLCTKLLVSFSVYTNGSKLLSTDQPAGSLTCVHGIRFLSMTWVVLGHSWGSPSASGMNALPYMQEAFSRWSFQGIGNALVSVDSFFVLSGLLVAYLSLKEMRRKSGRINWFLFYFHRFWRLTPAYMLLLMVYTCLAPYWGQGPFWPAKFADEDFCARNWWTNLLYINNFVNMDEACFGHTWYLANDMQFYILSPLIFVPFYFSPLLGSLVFMVFLLATSITPGVLTDQYNLPPGLLQQVEGQKATAFLDYFKIYYLKPYNRMGAYVVGMLAGYFLYRTDCKLRIPRIVNLCLWGVATGCAMGVLYGLYDATNGHPLTLSLSAFYNAVHRQVWAACVAWVVVACVTGNGGFVNSILSWRAFIPLSRLTYCIYLLHIMMIDLYVFNMRSLFYMDDLNLTLFFLGILVVSFMAAFLASLAFEAPMMALEKVLLHRNPPNSDKSRTG